MGKDRQERKSQFKGIISWEYEEAARYAAKNKLHSIPPAFLYLEQRISEGSLPFTESAIASNKEYPFYSVGF